MWPRYENSRAETRAEDTHAHMQTHRELRVMPSVNCSHIYSSAVLAPHKEMSLVTIFSLDNQNPEIFPPETQLKVCDSFSLLASLAQPMKNIWSPICYSG